MESDLKDPGVSVVIIVTALSYSSWNLVKNNELKRGSVSLQTASLCDAALVRASDC